MVKFDSRTSRKRGGGPPVGQAWVWLTSTMLGSISFGALGVSALRILAFLLHEHACHGGAENGNLTATYIQLKQWGLTPADIRKGFAELRIIGFVDLTHQGLRVADGRDPSRYALTWYSTRGAFGEGVTPPSNRWQKVIKAFPRHRVGNVVERLVL